MPTRIYGYKPNASDVLHILDEDAENSFCGRITDIDITEAPWGRCKVYRLDNHAPDVRLCQNCLCGVTGRRTRFGTRLYNLLRRHYPEQQDEGRGLAFRRNTSDEPAE